MTFCLYNMLKTQQTGLLLTSMVENLMKVQLLQLLLALSAIAVPQSLPAKKGTGEKSIFKLTLTKETSSKTDSHCAITFLPLEHIENTMNRSSTDLYGRESNGKSAFATAPGIISNNNVTISASVNSDLNL
jgi:hypothetical protein